MPLAVAVMEVKQGVNYMFLQHHLIAFGDYRNVHVQCGRYYEYDFPPAGTPDKQRTPKQTTKRHPAITPAVELKTPTSRTLSVLTPKSETLRTPL